MEELISLVEVVTRNKVKNINVIGEIQGKNATKVNQLYLTLLEGEKNEDRLAEQFFPEKANRKRNFSNLKSQLKQRLIDTVFFIDTKQPNFSDLQKAYYSCYKYLNAVNILQARAAKKPAISIAEKTIKQALVYDFTNIVLELARILRLHFGSSIGDKKKFEYYNQVLKESESKYHAELLVEEYFSILSIDVANRKSFDADFFEKGDRFIMELERVPPNERSFKFNFILFIIYTIRYESANDYRKTLEVVDNALEYFEEKSFLISPLQKLVYLIKKLSCQIALKYYIPAEKTSNQCLGLANEGSRNWFVVVDYIVRLFFHSGQYQKVYDLFKKVSLHPNFKRLPPRLQENWHLHEGFVYFLISRGLIEPKLETENKKFRLSKFINEVPTFSKDKRGTNITIIVIQILFLLNQGKYGEIIDRMDALKMYTFRYLRKDDTFRSNCFLKMLIQLPASSFHKTAVIRATEKYYKKLRDTPVEATNQSIDVEIIPFEKIWEFILDGLDNRFHEPKRKKKQ